MPARRAVARSGEDRFHVAVVVGAAAEVAGERRACTWSSVGCGFAVEQRPRRHQLSRRAEAALRRVVFDEGLLQRIERAAAGASLRPSAPLRLSAQAAR